VSTVDVGGLSDTLNLTVNVKQWTVRSLTRLYTVVWCGVSSLGARRPNKRWRPMLSGLIVSEQRSNNLVGLWPAHRSPTGS
jgi:hypothetical protein